MLHPVQVVFVCDFSYVMAFRLERPDEFWQHFRLRISSKQLYTTKVKRKEIEIRKLPSETGIRAEN